MMKGELSMTLHHQAKVFFNKCKAQTIELNDNLDCIKVKCLIAK